MKKYLIIFKNNLLFFTIGIEKVFDVKINSLQKTYFFKAMLTSHLRKKIKFSKDFLFYINIIFKFQGKHVSVEKKRIFVEKRVTHRKQAFHDAVFLTHRKQAFHDAVFLTHDSIWQMLMWLSTWKAKSLYCTALSKIIALFCRCDLFCHLKIVKIFSNIYGLLFVFSKL